MATSKLSVGNVEVLALTDMEGRDFPVPLSQVFPGVSAEAWAPFRERYPEMFNGPDSWRMCIDCYIIRSEGRTILVDTGVGSMATNPGTVAFLAGGEDGRLMAELEAAGVRPEDVDTVFLTHLHPDHVGWNLSQGADSRSATFPRARYLVHQTDWDDFKKPELQEGIGFKFWEETIGPLETLGVLDLLSGETPLTGEITAIHTPGHTLGHMSLTIVSQGQHALMTGDMAVHPAQLTETGWGIFAEMDQALAAETRRRVLDKVEADDAMLVACHFPSPGFGRLVRIGERRYWQGI